MRQSNGASAPVDLSVQLYNWLLAAYPGRFRAEYAYHMAQVFRDVCRRDYRRGGLAGMASLWARTSLDLIRTTVEEHIERGIEMNREKFVRWSGWALIAGAILFAAGLIVGRFDSHNFDPIGGVDAVYEIGQIAGVLLGQILFVVGLLGLRAGYARRSGGLGAGLLALTVVGAVVSLAGMLVMSASDVGWNAWMLGMLAMTLTLAIFGVVAIRRRVFSRWNFAPLLAGIVVPIIVLFSLGLDSVAPGWQAPPEWLTPVGLGTMLLGLVLLGYRMQADAGGPSELAV